MTRADMIEQALRNLLEAIDCLDGVEYSKDLPVLEAETIWEAAQSQARKALRLDAMHGRTDIERRLNDQAVAADNQYAEVGA